MNKMSFIIPTYNTNIDSLNKCLNSIINQKIESYEIILINDGSTNNDIDDFCKEIEINNKCIKYFYQENSGSAVARNLGLDNFYGLLF